MPQAPPLALIVGCTGAGKTTYARQLADRLAGVRFSIDEWMMALFWPDSPQPLQFAWTMERVNRCEAQIFATARQLAERGVPAMLDLGFTTRDHREKFRSLAAEHALSAQIHFVDVPAVERWRRVEQRNQERGETYAMTVDRGMFDFMETRWEPRAKPNGRPMADAGSPADRRGSMKPLRIKGNLVTNRPFRVSAKVAEAPKRKAGCTGSSTSVPPQKVSPMLMWTPSAPPQNAIIPPIS